MIGGKQSGSSPVENMIKTIKALPSKGWQLLQGKWETFQTNSKMTGHSKTIVVDQHAVKAIRKELIELLGAPEVPIALSDAERRLLSWIKERTTVGNRNNVTRTECYYRYYRMHPELHWAFLAHMVSRNGGWFMTDLKGDLLPKLLSPSEIEAVFSMLESANSFIFGDAYPQLLLYAESKKQGRSLHYLLPHLGVSTFMKSVWKHFWELQDSSILTISLIVNEQSYIQPRVVESPYFVEKVLETPFFKTQAMLQLNQVVFPYLSEQSENSGLRLAGLILEDFTSLEERIEVGKKLYSILFGIPEVHQGAEAFASSVSHTGSRADYWPTLYRFEKPNGTSQLPPSGSRLQNCSIQAAAEKYWSPTLKSAWPDRKVTPPAKGDWCKDVACTSYIKTIHPPFSFDMTGESCFSLNKIELAVQAGKLLR